MTLREQIQSIAILTFPLEYVRAVNFPKLVDALAIRAFRHKWQDCVATRAIRRAIELFEKTGMISEDEPEVF